MICFQHQVSSEEELLDIPGPDEDYPVEETFGKTKFWSAMLRSAFLNQFGFGIV